MNKEIKNLKKTSARILKAIKTKERIIIYGDADLDGVTSVIILKEAIRNLGGEITALYFPDREKEGYGISRTALKYLEKLAPGLLIALDCGIGNFEEVEIANKMGFEVIIIDHHEPLEKFPEASIIVDPKQKGDKYPFKDFANVGLVFKLSEVLLKKKMTQGLRRDFLELTAMATIADMMPRVDENEIMIKQGLSSLESSWRPGIQALLELEESQFLNLIEKVYKMNSFLNIRDVKNRMPAAFRLLTCSDKKEAEKLAKKLVKKGIEKKQRVRDIIEQVKMKIFAKSFDSVIFEGDAKWELVLLGVAASLLVKEYKKPVFLYRKQRAESQGAIRAPKGFNVVEAMKEYSGKLLTFGGHPLAAGFRIKNKDLEEFKEYLMEYFHSK